MEESRPALAYTMVRQTLEPVESAYDEGRQMSVRNDGGAAVTLAAVDIETSAQRDTDEPIETKAARDPDDLSSAFLSPVVTLLATDASADSDIQTFAERDLDDPVETRADRDPDDHHMSRVLGGTRPLMTEAAADPDDDESEPDPLSPDDLVTGVVPF